MKEHYQCKKDKAEVPEELLQVIIQCKCKATIIVGTQI